MGLDQGIYGNDEFEIVYFRKNNQLHNYFIGKLFPEYGEPSSTWVEQISKEMIEDVIEKCEIILERFSQLGLCENDTHYPPEFINLCIDILPPDNESDETMINERYIFQIKDIYKKMQSVLDQWDMYEYITYSVWW